MSSLPFTRVVVLCNPASTHAKQAKKRIEALKELTPAGSFLLLETLEAGREANKAQLLACADWLGPETLLCVAAGDGTVNMVVETLLTADSPHISDTVLLPFWGGNANDLAHMLNGPSYRMPVKTLLERGHIVTIHPLLCDLTTNEMRRTMYALGYISFGATALAARGLNQSPHRTSRLHRIPGGRIMQEVSTVAQALLRAPSFRVEDEGKERFIYDRLFINGSRIGKLRPLPLRLTDNVYYKATVSEKRLGAALARIRELLRRPSVEEAHTATIFRCLDEAWMQFDGEAHRLDSGTVVSVTQASEVIRAWSVRLPGKGGSL